MHKVNSERSHHVNREVLVDVLKANLAKHRGDYEAALVGWRKQVAADFSNLQAIDHDTSPREFKGTLSDLNNLVQDRPRSHITAYEEAIAAFEADVRKTQELTAREFRAYWLDRWDWSSGFTASLESYSR